MAVDWEAIRLQYEIYNESIEILATENEVPMNLIEYAIKDQNWHRAPMKGLMNDVRTVEDVEEITDDVVDAINSRLEVVNALKTASLNPRYIALENAILTKSKEIVTSLIAGSVTSADQLKKVAEVLKMLKEQSLPAHMRGGGTQSDEGRVVVQILSKTEIHQQNPSAGVVVQ